MLMFRKAFVYLLLSNVMTLSQAQPNPLDLQSDDFDAWISQHMSENGSSDFCRIVVDRLKAQRRTSSSSIMKCVEREANSGQIAANAVRRSSTYIDQILANCGDDNVLRAQLLRRKGSLLLQGNDFAGAATQFERALTYSNPARLEADWQYQSSLVSLGQALSSIGKKKEAESYFLQALSYPWYTITKDADELQRFRDVYVQAGRGLIDVRRNNLQELKSIVFVPASMNDLGPALDEAIRTASK